MSAQPAATAVTVAAVVAELKSLGSDAGRAGMARYGINIERALGVSMAAIRPIARRLKRNHAFAGDLWATGWHEARLLAALTDEPTKVQIAQMDAWAADFDSWDLCDQACSKLFARTVFAQGRVAAWANDERQYVRRAAFALIAALAARSSALPDDALAAFLPLIERHATDDRSFVRKAVNWALRQIGKRSLTLHRPALALAHKLSASDNKTARWIGKDATRELTDPGQLARIARRG